MAPRATGPSSGGGRAHGGPHASTAGPLAGRSRALGARLRDAAVSDDGGRESPSGRPAPLGRLDEATVLTRLRGGDEALFRDVVDQLTPVMLRLARAHTPTAAAAQDAVQDTWLVVLDKLDTFQGRSSLKTWICGILVHKARRSGVREHRTLPFSSAWRDEHGPAVDRARFHGPGSDGATGTWASPPVRWDQLPEDQLAASELRRVIDAAIAGLPPRQREVITARDVLGMDAEETAAVLRVSAGNQRVLLHRARSKVRAVLEQYGVDVLAHRLAEPELDDDDDEAATATATATDGSRAPASPPTRGSDPPPQAPGPPALPAVPPALPRPEPNRSRS